MCFFCTAHQYVCLSKQNTFLVKIKNVKYVDKGFFNEFLMKKTLP